MHDDSYVLLDFGNGKRLEQWGKYRLIRPDPTATGAPADASMWESADATYEGEKGKGEWVKHAEIPDQWTVGFDDLQMTIRLAPYKHTGVFPEQMENWKWMRAQGKKRSLKILNLFAYTGGASVALAKDGHHVTHIDSSKPAIEWAKDNALLNSIAPDRIRWITDDAATFVARELKRGNRYDAVILDPPAYGHGPSGKAWRAERDLAPLLENIASLFSDAPAFLVLNGYARQDTPDSFRRLLTGILRSKTKIQHIDFAIAELVLSTPDNRRLSTGVAARCAFA